MQQPTNHLTPEEKVLDFFSHYTLMRYQKNERILRENENPSGVFLLQRGIVRVYLISEEGNELTVMMEPEGSIFPLRWVINDLPNIYNYQTMNPVELWRAPKDGFLEFLEHNPDVLMLITQQLSTDVNVLIYRLQHVVFGNAQAKVASIVLTAAKRFGHLEDNGKITTVEVPLTHQQIADSAGVTRETASLEMKKLKEKGLINYQGRSLVIMDMDRLVQASFL